MCSRTGDIKAHVVKDSQFCVVSYVLALAFGDDAFPSLFITGPGDIPRFQISGHRQGIPNEWKEAVAEKLLLRRAVWTLTGV